MWSPVGWQVMIPTQGRGEYERQLCYGVVFVRAGELYERDRIYSSRSASVG